MPAVELQAFEALQPDLLRLARVLLRGSRVRLAPEDLVQATLTKILGALRAGTLRVESIESPRSFAYAALRNLFLDEVKAHRTRFEQALESGADERSPGRPVDGAGPSLLVKQVLGRFEPPERCFLLRVVFEERSVTEAQELCGWPPLSPYYHLRLLLDRAREML